MRLITAFNGAQRILLLLLMVTLTASCSAPFEMPFLQQSTPTFTPTPTNTPTPTPAPTETPRPGETPAAAIATPIPTPQVTIPAGWVAVRDERLGYSLAIPPSWTEVDLRGNQMATMAGMIGQGESLRKLQNFLATDQGQAIGALALELDMMSLMQGNLPPLLNVSVIPLPDGADADYLKNVVDSNLALLRQFGDVEILAVEPDVVNNLPAIRATANADLSSVGFPTTLFVKAVGLVANNQLYILTTATRAETAAEKEPLFDQIIGSFRPE
ncbi:MAG: hypothetical protein KDE50_14860 [Caldilineaceae bacterium]|nr:hypothetical protein [Caldilineaceae bacterium]